jgi:beta-galactosidase
LIAGVDPDRTQFAHLRYAPFVLEMGELFHKRGDLRIEGYIGGKQVIEKRMSGGGVEAKFLLLPDDNELVADGADTTRVVLRITDEFGAVQPFANDSIRLELDGPAEFIGDNPFSLIGGTGAVWIRALEQPGTVRLKAIHPSLGVHQIEIGVKAALTEMV